MSSSPGAICGKAPGHIGSRFRITITSNPTNEGLKGGMAHPFRQGMELSFARKGDDLQQAEIQHLAEWS